MKNWSLISSRAFEIGICSHKNLIFKNYAGFPDKLIFVYTFDINLGFWKIRYRKEDI